MRNEKEAQEITGKMQERGRDQRRKVKIVNLISEERGINQHVHD